jgi:hypothetical protein
MCRQLHDPANSPPCEKFQAPLRYQVGWVPTKYEYSDNEKENPGPDPKIKHALPTS